MVCQFYRAEDLGWGGDEAKENNPVLFFVSLGAKGLGGGLGRSERESSTVEKMKRSADKVLKSELQLSGCLVGSSFQK